MTPVAEAPETIEAATADQPAARAALTSALADPFHAYRIGSIAHRVGLNAHVSPTDSSPVHGIDNVQALARETVAVAAGRLVGYDRLDRWLGR